MSLRVGIAGHHGYSGAEILRILTRHSARNPQISPVLLDHRESTREGPEYLSADFLERIPITAAREGKLDLVFLAVPTEAALELVPEMLDAGVKVIDLSGAHRLKTVAAYERWYGGVHPHPELLSEAAYGLPEFHRDAVRGARLIANPGCYPTAANLAIKPLVEHQLADLDAGIVCDAKSGVSGAGNKPTSKNNFCEVTENFSAYAILQHRHVPEILMHSRLAERHLSFSAQLLPIDRGILETIYFRAARPLTEAEILDVYKSAYENEPFVRLHALGSVPDLHHVQRTNFCDIGIRFDASTGRGVIVSAIDNLGKGAAGQAIQNMNLMLGRPETEGLI
jgi:N-acetyl-gamma-glutamyl-phosphate reductase